MWVLILLFVCAMILIITGGRKQRNALKRLKSARILPASLANSKILLIKWEN